MKTRLLHISEIDLTGGTQIRAKIDADAVQQYADDMQESQKFPPIVVFHDGSRLILADGFHRVMAASRNGFLDIEADMRKGTRADALKFALSANATHGLKRTNADKRRSVELALQEWPKISDAEIARICAVSQPFVGDVRRELQPITDIGSADEKRTGADGKKRRKPKRKPKEKPEPPQAEEPATESEPDPAPAVIVQRYIAEPSGVRFLSSGFFTWAELENILTEGVKFLT